MEAKSEFRDRPGDQVAVLDALCDRAGDGMTVLELRAAVDTDIDAIEAALSELKDARLITVEQQNGSVRVYPHDRVVPDPKTVPDDDPGLFEKVRRRIGL